jgi:16S rRNA (guanine527-N7)-methyltransferase
VVPGIVQREGPRAALLGAVRAWGLPLDGAQVDALLRFGELLLEWSARINLTGARALDTLVSEHFPDAFALAATLDGPSRLVDVGSGGGLPAIPLVLLRPSLRATLVEPLAKKVAFLRTAVRELGLGNAVEVVQARAEALPAGTFDAAMSRATFAPAAWVRVARRLVGPGGRIFVLTVPDVALAGRRTTYFGGRRCLVEVSREDVPRETES